MNANCLKRPKKTYIKYKQYKLDPLLDALIPELFKFTQSDQYF
jgi:hypothetical protein